MTTQKPVLTLTKSNQSQAAIQSEWELVQAAQRDPAMFRPLYDRYYEPIFRFIFKRTADEDLCADLCAQVFLKAMQKLNEYRFLGLPFSSWLYRIATNEVTQHFRDQKRNRVVTIEDKGLHFIEEESGAGEDLELSINIMQSVIQELDDDEVQLIELRFFEQRPFAEIAQITGITENNAKVRTYRLLEKIKKRMVKRM